MCDGKNVWNISQSDKTVIINSYSASGNELSLDKIFFAAMNVYKISVVEESKKGGKLRLTPPNIQARIGALSAINISLNSATTITALELDEMGSLSRYNITKLLVNKKIPANTFTYSAPSGWKVVDLR